MDLRRVVSCVALGVVLSSGALPAFADSGAREQARKGFVAHMKEEGWQPVAPGVLQRQKGKGKVETFAFGVRGLEWVVRDLESRLDLLLKEQGKSPFEDGARLVEDLQGQIEQTRRDLEDVRRSGAPDLSLLTAKSGCDFSYGASADAYPLTAAQGMGATATAYFQNNCGYEGTTYARAAASTSTGGPVSSSDSDTGTYVASSAAAQSTGSGRCSSSASSSVQSSALGIYFAASDSNSACPQLSIGGTAAIEFSSLWDCHVVIWTAEVTGGTPPFSYNWSWYGGSLMEEPGETLKVAYCGDAYAFNDDDFPLTLTVSDSAGSYQSTSMRVHVYSPCPSGCW